MFLLCHSRVTRNIASLSGWYIKLQEVYWFALFRQFSAYFFECKCNLEQIMKRERKL